MNSLSYYSEDHLRMVNIYWVTFALQFLTLIWAYTRNIHIIYFTHYLYTLRMIWPIYDMENRREYINKGQWYLFVCIQNTITAINLIIFNNMIDKSAIPVNLVTITLLFYFTVHALYPADEISNVSN